MIKKSELIINPDGSIYHLGLKPEDICDLILTVGDPQRIDAITQFFDEIIFEKSVREFRTVRGRLKGRDLMVISTGIGTDNIDIVLTELDACANINFHTREIKKDFRQLTFIRIGTSGSLQHDIPVDSLLVSVSAIGLDGLMNFYKTKPVDSSTKTKEAADRILHSMDIKSSTYIGIGDQNLVKIFSSLGCLKGTTLTSPGFYGPQGRMIRIPNRAASFIESMSKLNVNPAVSNLEMETAGIYAMANALDHRAVSLNAILANRRLGKFSTDPQAVIEKLIKLVITNLDLI